MLFGCSASFWTPMKITLINPPHTAIGSRIPNARGVPPWRVFLWFKTIEVLMQARPRVLRRMLFHRDSDYRHAMRWYTRIGRRVWFHEVIEFLFKSRPRSIGPTLREFMGRALADREYVLVKPNTRLKSQRGVFSQENPAALR